MLLFQSTHTLHLVAVAILFTSKFKMLETRQGIFDCERERGNGDDLYTITGRTTKGQLSKLRNVKLKIENIV
jgi:hypothetical protein